MVSAIVGLEPIRNGMENNMTGNGKEKGPENESSAGTTTTTISTIAVRAEPHSTVVVALLKSIGYVDLRIDKMRPGLLEIGSTPEENAQLLLIHTDLFQRLLGKQQQVEELLGRAEQLVHEQTEPGDVMVYEAMADGLAAAWKGLSRQLEMRGYILMDSQKLYDLALKHEELSKILNSRLQIEEQPKGSKVETQQIVNELAELTSDGMAIGSNLITQIRVLGSLADNADRPREVFEACLDIEKIMLKMAESWELLEGEWRNLNPKDEKVESGNLQIQINEKSGQMDTSLEMAEKWLKEAQEKFEKIKGEEEERQKVGEIGKCIKELQKLLDETKANQSNLQQLAERIYAKCTELPPEMSTKCADLLERYNRLSKEIQIRLELLKKILQWIKDADGLLTQLAKMRRELGNADEAMAGELGPLAQQKGLALIEQGEQLVAQWNDGEGGGKSLRDEIAEKVHKLKESVIEVVQLARERIAAGKAHKLGEKIISLEQWIQKMADPFIQKRISLSPFAPEIAEFISIHRKFGADLTDKEQQCQSIQSQQKLLAQNELERLGMVQKRMAELREILEIRMQLGKKMEQLQKLSRELETSFHFLSTLLQQNSELGNQKNTEQQVRHLLQNLNENCIQEKHHSDNFQLMATECQENDPNLGLIEAMGWSRAQITAHREQFNLLNEKCRIWEQNRKERINGRPPKFVMTLPDEKLIWEGERLELMAKIDGDPEPKIYWLKDGKELRERAGQCRIGWLNGMATLIIEEVMAEDGGEYSLRAENANGCAEGKIILIVKGKEGERIFHQQKTTTMTTRKIISSNGNEVVEELGEFKPRFVKQLENVSVREGEQFQLDCLVVGNPEPKIIWYREEQTVRESDRIRLSFKGDHCTLNCTNAGNEDAGLYNVLAANVHGETMNFCRVVIVPPSPKRKIPPPTPPKPSTPVEMMKNARMEHQQKHQREELMGEIVEKKAAIPPRLEPQLCSQIVREGQTVIFQTFISGSPSPKVQWFYNGQQIQMDRPDLGLSRDEDGKCTLTIPCVLLEHSGQYGLEANNEFGQASSSATLNVLLDIGGPTNSFGMQIDDAFPSGEEGINMMKKTEQKLITTRTISGHQQQHFIVQQNQELPNGGSHQESYFSRWTTESPAQGPIYSVSKSERAESRRTSSDLGDPGYSSLANAPECLRPFPTEVTINEGERMEVDCLILGNPRPKVQWFFNERPIKSSPDFVELTNIGDTYAIRFCPARLENAGWYRLVAENIRGRNESLTLIHVRPKSMIPKPAIGQQKGRRSIGGVQGLLNWQKQKLLQQQQQTRALSTPPRPPNYYSTQTPPPTNVNKKVEQMPQIMSMSAYQPREEEEGQSGIFHNGNQPLVESHSEHRLISTDELLLTKTERANSPHQKGSPPHFMQTLVSAVLNEGQSARFEAVVTGLPPPKLEWTKNGQPLLGNDKKIRIWTEGGRAILMVNEIDGDDAGKYCCMAENASGMASSTAQLVLRPKTMAPDFVERLVSEEVEEGSFLKWTVRASGEPEPTVCWLRDGQLILEVEGASMKKEGPFVYSLLIGNVQLEDAGQFTCILENNAGEARSTADLVVRPKGAAPGKYVHVTKVTQEKQIKGEELARNETVIIDSQLMEGEKGGGNEEEEEEEEEELEEEEE